MRRRHRTKSLSGDGCGRTDLTTRRLQSASPTSTRRRPTSRSLMRRSERRVQQGTVVGALTAVDPDVGDTASFSLTDNDGGLVCDQRRATWSWRAPRRPGPSNVNSSRPSMRTPAGLSTRWSRHRDSSLVAIFGPAVSTDTAGNDTIQALPATTSCRALPATTSSTAARARTARSTPIGVRHQCRSCRPAP